MKQKTSCFRDRCPGGLHNVFGVAVGSALGIPNRGCAAASLLDSLSAALGTGSPLVGWDMPSDSACDRKAYSQNAVRCFTVCGANCNFRRTSTSGDWWLRIVVCVLYRVDSRVFLPYRCFRLMAAVSCTEFPLVQYGFATASSWLLEAARCTLTARADLSLSRTPDTPRSRWVDVYSPCR